jgi:LmbE family N-acetylglucosaminyl deacetylase
VSPGTVGAVSVPDSYDLPASIARVTLDLPTPKRALAIGAHPDDVEFGCGGTVAKWADDGCDVFHLVLTDGSKGTWDPNVDEVELVSSRQREQREAARILRHGAGTDDQVVFLGWIDGELDSGLRQRGEVAYWIRRFAPDVVLGHDPWRRYRIHPDHRHAGFLTTDGIVAARDPKFFPEHGLASHRPSHLLLWEADEPDHVEHIEGMLDRKLHALLAHRSQYETTMHIAAATGDASAPDAHPQVSELRDALVDRARDAGRLAGVEAGEAFKHIVKL